MKRNNSDSDDDADEIADEPGFVTKSRFHHKQKKYQVVEEDDSDENEDNNGDDDDDNKNNASANLQANSDYLLSFQDGEEDVIDSDEAENHKIVVMNLDEFNQVDYKDDGNQIENEGVAIEAFNLVDESKYGVFDQYGNYIEEKEDEDEQQQDQWINDYDDEEHISLARDAQKNRMAEQHLKKRQRTSRVYMLEDALLRLKYLLPKSLNALNSLSLLNKKRQFYMKKSGKNKADSLETAQDREAHLKHVINGINLITELVETLEQKGIENVYELSRSQIEKLYNEETLSGNELNDYETKQWSFKWISDATTVNEYYSNYEMQYWKETYFNDNVIVKFKDDDDREDMWVHICCLTFM
ncbi:HCL594Wp [Eremothecium sinecaudum]|uniref:HCL594Wp n=1 Tax=Eremothecium sinecaudum TaxID=45286 RepID=A0A109UYB7_9SACH|nr:HCL594Wp [Eremothecium sinecaudum]AMD19557.1 HCL594Wp [Eremothecium sinecaudum]